MPADFSDLEREAARFAAEMHKDQKRKFVLPGEDDRYILHPAAVADIVRSVTDNPEMLAAAWLHDVVEDCQVPFTAITQRFGFRVHDLVEMLTDVAVPADGNRKARMEKNRLHTLKADADGQTVKCADMIHNMYRVYVVAPKFAPTFCKEMSAVLDGLTQANQTLVEFRRKMAGDGHDDPKWLWPLPETMVLAGI